MPEMQSTAEALRNLIRRFDPASVQAFQGAMAVCATRANYELVPEHLLLRLLDDTGDVNQILNTFKIDRARVRRAVLQVLDEQPTGHPGKPAISPKLVELFSAAAQLSEELGFEQIRPGLIMLAIAINPGHTRIGDVTPELERIDVDQLRDHFHEIIGAAGPQEAGAGPAAGGPAPARGEGSALAQFTVDLTAKAESGGIDPVFGRDHEIRQMIDIFARRRKNNPILVGEPGTGKTAIVEGLALRIVKGDVPPTLKGVRLLSLDLGLLQAGAGVKGEFENRLKNVIKEIKGSEKPVITFIDEAHTLIGAGGSAGGSDASNLLKPALARGELRTVAATTWAEYKKYFEKDAALERRFQLVRCEEPSVEDTIVMLRGLKEIYEKHHKVVMLDESVIAAARLAKRYISGRFLPDKAVDLLDTTAARVGVGLSTPPAALEDIDRGITQLDTAVAALERDRAGGTTPDEDLIKQMQADRVKLVAEREEVEKRWQAELAAVNKVRELRKQLRVFGAGAAEGDGKAAADAKPAQAEKPADESAIRRQIDEAIKEMKKLQGDEPLLHPHVDASAVASVVSDWTGIPIGSMVKDEIETLLKIEESLRKRVVGQDHALTIVAQKLRTARSGLGNPMQPVGVFLCVGPSGVGKTELAKSIGDLLFGGEDSLITLNMSEYMESHKVSLLTGSPPGYVGYGEGGVLTEAVRKKPYSVVLFDEVEKAHQDITKLFYRIFDEGILADAEGRIVNFKNTVIILTSNLGTDIIQTMCESGEEIDIESLKQGIYPQLREHFKPALVARMTIVPFRTLSSEILQNIARMKVAKVGQRLTTAHKMNFQVDDNVYAAIASRCQQVDLGARQVDHVIDQAILPEMSLRLLERMGDPAPVTGVTLGVNAEGVFTYTFTG